MSASCISLAAQPLPAALPSALSWTVYGVPAPQGSARAFLHRTTGRIVVTHGCSRTVAWRQQVSAALIEELAQRGHDPHTAGPLFPRPAAVRVTATFYLARPKSLPKRFVTPTARPDLDKLLRAALDAMTGLAFEDDSQVAEIRTVKAFGLPRAEFAVEVIA